MEFNEVLCDGDAINMTLCMPLVGLQNSLVT